MYIEIKNAVKKYGNGQTEVFALNNLSLELDKGEICVVLGPSGSGKSTLINMLGGIDTLTSGNIVINEKDISNMSKKELTEFRRREVGFVFQSYNLIPDLTLKENVQVVEDISDKPVDIDELLENLELTQHKDKFPNELSGGQQQRCAIARALIKNPSLLLCDEPTGALDSKSSRGVLRVLERINRIYNTTIVIITHNDGIAQMADRVIRIHDGSITENIITDKVNGGKINVEDLSL